MSKHSDVSLQINQILLDPVNPRHEPLHTQVEQIKAMIDNQKEKLVRLANDIVNQGLNPSDLVTVIPHANEKNKYIVVEGNRRITALKLLNSPSLCHDEALRGRFEILSKTYIENPINEIKCVLYPDRESATHWISLKHTGQNNGVGTVDWNATEVMRFQAQNQDKKESLGLQVMNFILKNLDLDAKTIGIIRSMPITTVERLIGDPDVRKAIGLSIDDGILTSKLSRDCTAKTLYELIAPIATGEKKVTDVYYKKDRKKYMDNFGQIPIDTPENLSADEWPLNSPPKPESPKPAEPSPPKPRSKPLSISRKYVIPSSCVIKITNTRINSIYYELKNHLKVDEVPNACAVLLRVFVELSVDIFITNKKVEGNQNDKFHDKLKKIADFMENESILEKHELKPVRKAASVPHSLFSTNTFNAYVHNSSLQPRSNELKVTWDEMELFIKKLWE